MRRQSAKGRMDVRGATHAPSGPSITRFGHLQNLGTEARDYSVGKHDGEDQQLQYLNVARVASL
jgi:hypothetical protein